MNDPGLNGRMVTSKCTCRFPSPLSCMLQSTHIPLSRKSFEYIRLYNQSVPVCSILSAGENSNERPSCASAFFYLQYLISIDAVSGNVIFKLFQCSIFIIRSFITDRLLKPFYIFFRYMQPFRRCIFAHHQTGVDDFLLEVW